MAIENWGFAAGKAPAAATPIAPSGLDNLIKANGLDMTTDQFLAKYGVAPEGGWSDQNTYQTPIVEQKTLSLSDVAEGNGFDGRQAGEVVEVQQGYGSANRDLQGWLKDPSQLPDFSLYGSGSPEDIQRGYNILQHMAPRNIAEFNGLSPDVQKAILQNPREALQRMQQMANPANGDWLSVGAEGGFSDLGAYQTDGKNLMVDGSKYMQIQSGDDWSGPLGTIASIASMIPGPWQIPAMAVNAAVNLHNENPLGAVLSVAGMAAPNMGGELGAKLTGAAATDLSSKLVGNGLIGATTGAMNGNAGRGALTSLIGTGIGAAVNAANPVAKDDTIGQVANGAASSGLKTVANGLINSALGDQKPQSATNTNTSTADTSGGTRVTEPQVAAFRPTKIEKWGYA